MNLSLDEVSARARRIRMVLTDCDGVLTDGSLHYSSDGEHERGEINVFHIHDGLGLQLARSAGLEVGLISGRLSLPVAERARELGLKHVYQGVESKLEVYQRICEVEGLHDEQVAYLGDDLPDLPVLRRAGLAIAVADAVGEVRARAHLITKRRGGRGAVREALELILKAQGRWEGIVERYLQ
jgi:3-deoxy-D-manno-octulosonate 8-phosphate phosphatase (KDO 8-P phosphatase)